MRKLGSRQQQAFDFIKRVKANAPDLPGWHTFDNSVKREILSLEKRGLVEVSNDQYRLKHLHEPKRITCPHCNLLRINGVICHETGCENSGARYDDESGEWIKQRECFECGCTVDADDPCCNDPERYVENSIELEDKLLWFSGNYGIELQMTLEQACTSSHPGQCDDDVQALSKVPAIAEQLSKLDPEKLKLELKEYGAWDANELADHEENLQRILWIAAGDIKDQN